MFSQVKMKVKAIILSNIVHKAVVGIECAFKE